MTITDWCHHHCTHNKMADLAANCAVDGATSTQFELPTSGDVATRIQDLLHNDVGHWFDEQLATEGDFH